MNTATKATVAQNGKIEKSNGATAPAQETNPQILPEVPKIEAEKKVPVLLPSIEARLQKLEDLNELVEKRDSLVEHIGNLKRFHISETGGGCNLKLTDSNGKVFGIAHPSVIGEMVAMAYTKLNAELTIVESQIDFTI